MNKDDCSGCSKYNTCNSPCLYLDIIHRLVGPNKPLKERLSPPDASAIVNLHYSHKDGNFNNIGYKEVMADKEKARSTYSATNIESIRKIPDLLKRTVAAMFYAEIPLRDVSIILDKSERTIRRICQR